MSVPASERGQGDRGVRNLGALCQQLIEQARVGVWLIDNEAKTSLANQRLAQMLGYTPDLMLGRPIYDFMDAEGVALAEANVARRESGIDERHPFKLQHRDGHPIWTTMETGPVLDARGGYIGAVAFVFELDHAGHDDEVLRAELRLLRAAVDQVPSALVVASFPDGRIRLSNQAAHELVRLTGAPVAGERPDDLARVLVSRRRDGSVYAPEEVPLYRALAHGETIQGEEMLVDTPEGTTRHLLANAAPVRDDDGRVVAGVIAVSDMTPLAEMAREREELQLQVLQTQRLDSLSLLAGGIAHNFNNQLATVLGRAELALMMLEPGHAARRHVEQVVAAAESAAKLTRRMLAYAGRAPVDRSPVRLDELLRSSTELIRAALPGAFELHVSCQDCGAPVVADPTQVEQLLANLVWNAVDAQPHRDSVVRVSGRHALLDEATAQGLMPAGSARPGPHVLLEVSDDGAGISPDCLPRIFDPYFTTRQGKHGLGLSAVLGIVRGHQGGLRVRTHPGQGTTVQVWLPLAPDQGSPIAPASGEGQARVLVVDDDKGVAEMLAETLTTFGYAVESANSGDEAMERLAMGTPTIDLMLLDMSMPDMPGEELARRLDSQGTLPPFVVLTGYSEADVRTAFVHTPPVAVLQKPVRPAELFRQVDALLKAVEE